jgi:hypothetical protein
MSEPEDLLKLLNDSGYPLQLAAQAVVEHWNRSHQWSLFSAEHSWHHGRTGLSGYTDLILQSDQALLLVECKRVRHATWLFFHSRGTQNVQPQAKMWVSGSAGTTLKHFGWDDVTAEPPTPEANFCSLRGQTSAERVPLLEKTAVELALATEAFAQEHWPMKPQDKPCLRFYGSAIVTTASLRLATFDLGDVAISDGTLQKAKFVEVPYLRFRKQVIPPPQGDSSSILSVKPTSVYSKESTVFVVNALHFSEFLQKLRVSNVTQHWFSVA